MEKAASKLTLAAFVCLMNAGVKTSRTASTLTRQRRFFRRLQAGFRRNCNRFKNARGGGRRSARVARFPTPGASVVSRLIRVVTVFMLRLRAILQTNSQIDPPVGG